MDLLLELLFGLFFEMPMEMAMESKRLKPWVKTMLAFLVGNLITVLTVLMAWSIYNDPASEGSWEFCAVFSAVWFTGCVIFCILGHRRHWWHQKISPLQKPVTIVHRNAPDPHVTIRTASMADLDAIAAVEAQCFPPAEAASREEFAERLTHYADHFWLMFEGGRLISFVDGFVTDEPDLTDEMYANASMHDPAGQWQMIFGVNTVPDCRRRGYAAQLIEQAILDARLQGRRGVVLTCKPEKVAYYLKFGFQNEGISKNSTHGGAVWHQMRLTF